MRGSGATLDVARHHRRESRRRHGRREFFDWRQALVDVAGDLEQYRRRMEHILSGA